MRISDWSSDVCSSDLQPILHLHKADIVIGVIEREPVDRIPALHQEPGAYAQPCDDRQRLPVHIYPGSEPVDPLGKAYPARQILRSEEHTSELQSLMRISYAVFCLKKKKKHTKHPDTISTPRDQTSPRQQHK